MRYIDNAAERLKQLTDNDVNVRLYRDPGFSIEFEKLVAVYHDGSKEFCREGDIVRVSNNPSLWSIMKQILEKENIDTSSLDRIKTKKHYLFSPNKEIYVFDLPSTEYLKK